MCFSFPSDLLVKNLRFCRFYQLQPRRYDPFNM